MELVTVAAGIPVVPVLLLGFILGVWSVWTINSFRIKKIKVSESLSGVEVALTKRYDLLAKLLDASKGYLAHERAVFMDTVEVRKDMTLSQISQTEDRMDAVTEQVYAVAEKYPVLKSSQVFLELQAGIQDAEHHLEAARRVYNSNVKIYNTSIAKFPNCLLAAGRKPEAFFQAKKGVHVDLKITF